jgi:hypothetical protein
VYGALIRELKPTSSKADFRAITRCLGNRSCTATSSSVLTNMPCNLFPDRSWLRQPTSPMARHGYAGVNMIRLVNFHMLRVDHYLTDASHLRRG